jgi:uncharacterized damage-inducible protein DinB
LGDTVLVELIRGKGAHTDALACVAGLGADEAGRVPAPSPHSVFDLVFHVSYWIDYELARIRGESPTYPAHAAESWPEGHAPKDAKEWDAAVRRFEALLGEMTRLAQGPAEALARPVEITSMENNANQGSTLGDVLIQTVVHNSYHLGQIALVRRMLGAWPPPTGSDTW